MPAHLAAGTTLGRYKILSQLGAGGMGEVYLAEDAKLHRKIALKILPEDVATNRDRMRRFEQEATAAAALNHPNIAHIYEIGKERSSPTFSADQAEVHFISMEYIDGYTLRECIYQKHVELRKLLRYLQHVAEGLAKAHASGIVHRDLKPDNLMVTREGYAKILDFGLAKLVEQPDMSSVTASSQVSTALQPKHSVPGTVMGTVGYMSPEQAQGKVNEIDHRSDIFSFGCILFEAITKHRPFEAESTIKSLHKVVYEHPPLIKDFNPEAPPDLQRIVRRCLAKDPEERYQTIKDVALEIKEVRHEIDEAASIHATDTPALSTEKSVNANSSNQTASIIGTTQRSVSSVEYLVTGVKRHKAGALLGLVLGALALAALAYGLYVWWRRPEAMRKSAALKIAPFTSFPGTKGAPAFSWDGKQIAFVWSGEKDDNADIYVKLIGEGSPLRLTTDPLPDITPAWSPDGIHIAFIRVAPGERALFTIPRLGGAERRLFSSPELRQPDWSPDGKYLAVADSESAGDLTSIYLVSPESGVRKRLTQTPAQFNGDTNPKFSPNGEWVAFIRSTNFAVEDVYIVPVSGGEPRRLTNDGHQLAGLAWTADSREIVFSSSRGGSYGLWRVSTDGGPPEAVPGAGDNAQEPAISRQGNYLAYLFDGSDTNIWRAPGPNAKDRTIAPIKLVESTRNDGSPRYSPDGKKIAFASDRTGGTEVWVCDSEGHNSVQLTKFGGHAGAPRWSPDGKQILLDARPEGSSDIYVVGAEGGSPRRLTDQPSADILPEWSRDGRWIYFGSDRSGEWRLWRMPAAGGPAEQITKDLAYGPVAVDDQFVYYARSGGVSARRANQPGIWRVPLSGGEEVRVVDQGRAGNVSVIREGIAIFTNDSQPNPTIDFFSFAAGKWTNLLSIDRVNAVSFAGRISVSPDGQWVVYSRRDQMVKDIMLVENFR